MLTMLCKHLLIRKLALLKLYSIILTVSVQMTDWQTLFQVIVLTLEVFIWILVD